MKARDYAVLLANGKTTSEKIFGLCGRLLRGKEEVDFKTLTDTPETRKIIFMVDSDGLQDLLGKIGWEMFTHVGYPPDYLEDLVKGNTIFKAVVMPDNGPAKLATWENLLKAVESAYPGFTVTDNVSSYLTEKTFEEINHEAELALGAKITDKSRHKIEFDKLMQNSTNPIFVRAFLYDIINVNELYAGDGWTREAVGGRQIAREYVMANCHINEIPDAELIDIEVEIPQKTKPKKQARGRKNMKIHLLIIDPQNDFMDIDGATLSVPGANEDMIRLAEFVNRVGGKLEDIHVTMDSHRLVDITHPVWWIDENGSQPGPYTIISADDIENGIWQTRNPGFRKRTLEYAKQLEQNGLYQICVWPPHCLIGTWGHNVHDDLNQALQEWSEKEFAMIDYVTKGSNPWTEHYGGMQAEVPDSEDASTALNIGFIEMLAEADIVVVTGEALSHCVKATVTQIADNIGDEHIKKFHILTDCSSPVSAVPDGPDFPQIAQDWLVEMKKRGMILTTSTEFLA